MLLKVEKKQFVKFSELKVGDKFTHNGGEYIKVYSPQDVSVFYEGVVYNTYPNTVCVKHPTDSNIPSLLHINNCIYVEKEIETKEVEFQTLKPFDAFIYKDGVYMKLLNSYACCLERPNFNVPYHSIFECNCLVTPTKLILESN